jgi:hypothetical protein
MQWRPEHCQRSNGTGLILDIRLGTIAHHNSFVFIRASHSLARGGKALMGLNTPQDSLTVDVQPNTTDRASFDRTELVNGHKRRT